MSGRGSIAKLATMSAAQKRAEWRRLTGVPAPPAFGAGLLTRAIAHAMQEQAADGPDKALARRLRQLMAKNDQSGSKAEKVALKPGTWLSRTWHGEVHQVIVLDSGFEYRGERYKSLSAIARHITRAGWSGPRFFGLRSPRLGTMSVSHNG